MTQPTATLTRRRLLKLAGLTGGTLGAATLANLMLAPRIARAADYKALVCVFLYGGNDGLNTIVPSDNPRYAQYAGVRKALALPQASLLPLAGSSYGLHPSLAALAPAWADRTWRRSSTSARCLRRSTRRPTAPPRPARR